MMRLLKIELQKLWPNRAFKWMSTLYLIAMVIIAVGVMPFLKYLNIFGIKLAENLRWRLAIAFYHPESFYRA